MLSVRCVLTSLCVCVFIGYISGCPTNCASCYSNAEYCQKCSAGYWLNKDFKCNPCPNGCTECTGYSHCTKCKANYWNNNCNSVCYEHCDENGCDDKTGYCRKCKSGYYGIYCNKNCELCKNQTCDLRKCTYGCIAGYYESRLDKETTCRECEQNCTVCKDYHSCSVCKKGFYKQSYNYSASFAAYCHKCQWNCEECTEKSLCTVCKPGTTCEKTCHFSNCHRCAGSGDTERCAKCKIGYKLDGNGCVPCEIKNRLCLIKCTAGYWGKYCKKSCHEGCISCDQINGSCDVCHRKKYGKDCQATCSEHCADGGTLSNICRKDNGKCEFGCKDGYSGDKCDITPTTISSAEPTPETESDRRQSTGIDVKPKTSVSENSQSTAQNKASTTQPLEETDKHQTDLLIGLLAGGVLLLIIAIVVAVILLVVKRKKKRCKDETHVNDVGNEHSQNETGQDYIYTQPNKQRKTIYHNQKDICGPQNTLNNVVNIEDDMYQEIVEDETDIHTVLLEDIDDEPKSPILTDVNIPESDTYYNMVGLKRSRINLSNLFEYIKDKSDFENEFQKLPQGLTRTCNEALKPQNRAKNRYNGIYAYDATRVVLQSESYINANYIDCHSQSEISYIASLGPTKSTMNNFSTFWEMVWQEKSNKIVMLTNLEESEKMKCHQYWPNQGCLAKYGSFTISCTSEQMFSDFVVRKFNVEQHSEKRQVTHYHYTAWPDKTVPHTVASLLEFRDKVEQAECQAIGPMIVHCSAGIGRTGTYIALDILIREGRKEDSVDIFGCVIALRGQRVSLVQNVEQYIYLHHCVLYALTCESGTLPITSVPQCMTDGKIATQYESYQKVTLLTNKEKEKRPQIESKSRKENRKGADIPDDDHRLRLTLAEHDYINAVCVNGYEEVNKFIIAQTPLPNTVEDFISLLYQERCSYIVCLDEENIVDKTVAKYIPPANKVLTFGHFQAICTNSDSREDFVIRDLKISRIGTPPAKELMIRHCQFRGWKGSDIVPATIPFLNLISYIETVRKSHHPKQPIAVHCLTGSERGGLFSVVSVLLEKMVSEQNISVLNTISQIRSRRRTAIPDIEQLRFCYNCVEEILTMSDTNTYYNIGCV